jgi:5-methylcytosine-specific restriction endonuclease McrA
VPVSHVLVLNASYEPLGVVPVRRAVVLVVTGKALPVEIGGDVVRSERTSVPVPLIVRLARLVRVPYRATVPLTRRGVFARDGGRCVYCHAPATSLDHVVPRSRGGDHVWENVVSCCRRCNHAKADRTVSELGWRMVRTPRAPSGLAWRVVGCGRIDPCWAPYLGLETAAEPAYA